MEASRAEPPASTWRHRRRQRPPTDALTAQRRRAGLLFTLPGVVLIGALLIYPIGQTVYHSFTSWDGITSRWVGGATYSHLIHNPEFSQVLQNNALLVLAIPVAIALPLAVAFLIHSKIRGWRFFRSVFFLPTAVSWVVIGFISVRFFADDGILQHLLNNVGLGFVHPNMLSHERSALVAVMITFVWSMFGTNLIIFLAGMATIDPEIYDAAKVDGASPWQAFWKITFPLMLPVSVTAVVLRIIFELKLADIVINVTAGGPGGATDTVSSFIYREYRDRSNVGYGTMLAEFYLVIIIVFVSGLLALANRWMRRFT